MAVADKPKLYYFDTPGRAETIRLIFVCLGIEFDDVRFTHEEWKDTYKAQAPLGMAPFLEEGEFKLGGSAAISRYVAEKYNLGGSSAIENAQLASYVDLTSDIMSKMYGVILGPEDKREECKQQFLKDMPGKLAFLEKHVKSDKHFLCGDKNSWADFAICNIVDFFSYGDLNVVLKDCPKLASIASNIDGMEKVKQWRAKNHKVAK